MIQVPGTYLPIRYGTITAGYSKYSVKRKGGNYDSRVDCNCYLSHRIELLFAKKKFQLDIIDNMKLRTKRKDYVAWM